MTIKLYGFGGSPNVRKVSLLAAALDIPLTHVTLDFTKGEFRSPEYLAMNPNGKVPTVDDDGFVLWESGAILRYLAAKRPERGLVPSDPFEQAHLDQWLFWWSAHLEPALDRLVYERRVKPLFLGLPDIDPSIVAEAEAVLERFLPVLDGQLAGKEYVLGKLSIVDFAASPRLDGAATLEVDLSRYHNITAWLEGMRAKSYWEGA